MAGLRILPLGGVGNVTQNMYVYEYENEILLVDCGIGFPDIAMPGVDILIPDISYLQRRLEAGAKIVGMILTHGHDDHIAATPYILPELPDFPIYASALTAGFTKQRLEDGGVTREITVVKPREKFTISRYFSAESIHITHSVPDTRHYAITTPEGVIYHGSDFKLDKAPVDGKQSDLERIKELGDQGILAALVDCLRVERSTPTKSETEVYPAIVEALEQCRGAFIVTLMSSHIHRIQQVINAAAQKGRKVAFIGRSVEQNVDVATQLKVLSIPEGMRVDKREIRDVPNEKLCIIIAGSQGQEGSSLVRAVFGEHPALQIKPSDVVVFSADVIPGNEINYYGAVDELARTGITVIYPDISPDIHQSGHASAVEQLELVKALHPKFVMPIGGADRHRVGFEHLVAQPAGMSAESVLIPGMGDVLEFSEGNVKVADSVMIRPRAVDGLGIGDVGPTVLSDRKTLGQAGIIVVVIPRIKGRIMPESVSIVSRGFVFMKEANEVMDFIKSTVAEMLDTSNEKAKEEDLMRQIERKLSKRLYRIIQREPMIVATILNLD